MGGTVHLSSVSSLVIVNEYRYHTLLKHVCNVGESISLKTFVLFCFVLFKNL
jgi:hypothetical protein